MLKLYIVQLTKADTENSFIVCVFNFQYETVVLYFQIFKAFLYSLVALAVYSYVEEFSFKRACCCSFTNCAASYNNILFIFNNCSVDACAYSRLLLHALTHMRMHASFMHTLCNQKKTGNFSITSFLHLLICLTPLKACLSI